MLDHKDSNGQPCAGCSCEQSKVPHVPAGLNEAVTGCCGLQFGHGAFVFDANGNCIQEMVCCADKECGKGAPENCAAHGMTLPEHRVEVRGPFAKHPHPQKKAEALAKKVHGLSARDATGKPIADRVADAALVSVDPDKGEAVAHVTALEKRINPHNPDPEWHHVTPTDAEVAAVRAALGAN